LLSVKIFQRFKIDDTCSSAVIHGVQGFWGVISVGLFEMKQGLIYSGNPQKLQV